MRASGKCPKCGSTDISNKDLSFPLPGGCLMICRKLGFLRWKSSNVTPCVCRGCGYTELYADDPKVL